MVQSVPRIEANNSVVRTSEASHKLTLSFSRGSAILEVLFFGWSMQELQSRGVRVPGGCLRETPVCKKCTIRRGFCPLAPSDGLL